MSWDDVARENYFTVTTTIGFIGIFYQKDSIDRLNNLENFPYDKLKELIKCLTKIMPHAHFACPDWATEPYKVRVALVVGRSNKGGALTNDGGRRVGIIYGKPLNDETSPQQLYIFAFGKDNQELNDISRKNDWGPDWREHWIDNSSFFNQDQLGSHYLRQMVYKTPFTGELDNKLKEFLTKINDEYLIINNNNNQTTQLLLEKFNNTQSLRMDEGLNDIVRIPNDPNVITPLILTTILDFNRLKGSPKPIGTPNSIGENNITGVQNKMNLNTIYYGPPGTGKTHITISKSVEICDGKSLLTPESEEDKQTAIFKRYEELQKEGRIVFVTFHQSYGYEEFIQGLRPIVEKNPSGGNSITYEVIPGVFKKLCDEARDKSEKNYVIIIDEINRANISKVFGELITLLEESKRSGGKTPFSVKLPNYHKNNVSDENNVGEDFSVPSNLYVIGTMNTADRSIALLDTALRRRFHFEELMPDYSKLETNVEGINLQELLKTMNTRIDEVYDRDHMIGHAYFMGMTTLKEIQYVFKRQIIPLLTEYFYDDFRKIKYVLNDDGTFIGIKTIKINVDFETRSEIYQINNNSASFEAIKHIYDGS